MDDIGYRSAGEIATAIRAGRVSSREVLDALLERVDRYNGPLNALVTRDDERARAEATAADAAVARGDVLGPLHGVPMSVKDSFATAGMRTTCGVPDYSDLVPEVDAVPVARLRGAGAVIYGKTNLPIWAADTQSYNEVFGTTNNPWDLERTPGGSSGGSGASLAAGLSPIELGSDIGGSIRLPAHMSGVVGHKPSYGIVPAIGQIPGPPGTLTQADIAVAGPMARSVDDLELCLDVLAGPDDWNATSWSLDLMAPRHTETRQYRVAAWLDDPACPIDSENRAILERAATALSDAGAVVDTDARPDFTFDYATAVFENLIGAAMSGGFSVAELETGEAATTGGLGAATAALRHREWLSWNERRLQMRRKWHEFFTHWDAILLPVMPNVAIRHDQSEPKDQRQSLTVDGSPVPYWSVTHWMGLTGVTWLPATVVPAGLTVAGLPVGIQIAGPFLEDRTTLDIARRLSALLGGTPRPPGYD